MIVVSDTAPLNYAIQIGCAHVLPELFGEVFIPAAVADELRHPNAPTAVANWIAAPPLWLREVTLKDQPAMPRLGRGEAAAIALARELDADLLIDDQKGKRIAQGLGLRTIGLLSVLRIASERKALDLLDCLDRLERTNFFVPKGILAEMRRAELERRRTSPHGQ